MRLYEHRCRMCGQCAVRGGYCRMCGVPHATTTEPNQPVLNDVPTPEPVVEIPDAPACDTDDADPTTQRNPVEGHGPYDDDFPDALWVDLGSGG